MLARYKLVSRGPAVGRGVTAPDYVAVSGVAKKNSAEHPYTIGNELVCGELGRGLGLPIPPGFVIDDGGEAWHVSLDFNLAGQQLPPADCAALAQRHAFLSAGIIVFDSWIVNGDRHEQNIAFDQTTDSVTIFDHSHAFCAATLGAGYLRQWEDSSLATPNCLSPYLTDLTGVDAWLRRLEESPRFWIEDAVQKGAAVGLPVGEEQFCIDFLDRRRSKLRDLLRQEQNAFPSVDPQLWSQF